MSGGTFEYKENAIYEVACAIELELFKYDRFSGDKLKPETAKAIKKVAKQLHKLYKQAHAVDYFFACDTGEESLMKQLKEIK